MAKGWSAPAMLAWIAFGCSSTFSAASTRPSCICRYRDYRRHPISDDAWPTASGQCIDLPTHSLYCTDA